MLERLIQSINPSNLLELVFELIWDEYANDDISSVMDIPAWEPVDDVLCVLARRVREGHPGRRLNVILSVVAPQSTDLRNVKMGTLFSKFREEGCVSLQYFIDYLPPVSFSVSSHTVELTMCSTGRILLRYAFIDSRQVIRNRVSLSRSSFVL